MDYAMRNDVSLSTLRRHIKANKIQHRIENGRYLIWEPNGARAATDSVAALIRPHNVSNLEEDLQKAKEEIAELKTLIALYEERLPQRFSS